MIVLLLASSFLALCTLGMFDMAWGCTKRHGLGYAMGEWLATLLMAMLTGTALLMAVS